MRPKMCGRPLLIGDSCKVCKESRRMPGVKKLCQESGDSSKPQFIHGHMFGRNLSASLSHVLQMARNGHAIAQTFSENVYFALNRYFLTVPLLTELNGLNGSAAYRLDVITRAKANCIAYAKPAVLEKQTDIHIFLDPAGLEWTTIFLNLAFCTIISYTSPP